MLSNLTLFRVRKTLNLILTIGSLSLISLLFVQCAEKKKGAKISQIRGVVKLEIKGETKNAAVGDIIADQTTVVTEKDSSADLLLAGGGVFRVAENSKVNLEKLGAQTEVKLDKGSVLLGLKKMDSSDSFKVQTPTAVAGVRGTAFSVSADRNTIAVLSGSVQVEKSGKSVVVESLKEVETKSDKLEAKKLSQESAAELKEIIQIEGIEQIDGIEEIQKNLSLIIVETEKETLGNPKAIPSREYKEVK